MNEATLYLIITTEVHDTRAKARDCRRIIRTAQVGFEDITLKIATSGLTATLSMMQEVYPEQVLN